MKRKIFTWLTALLAICCLTALLTVSVGASDTDTAITTDDSLRVAYGNLVFKDTIYLRYAVSTETYGAEDMQLLIWTTPKQEADAYTYGTQDLILTATGTAEIQGVTHAVFDYKDLTAKQMTDYVYARAYVSAEGENEAKYGDVVKYSVLQYSYSLLGKTGNSGTTNEKLIGLINAMLNYGAAAQEYTGYKTDWLANDEFSEVKVGGGCLEDGFSYGLYRPGEKVKIKSDKTGEYEEITAFKDNVTIKLDRYSEGLEYKSNGDGTCGVVGIGTCTDTELVIPSVSPDGDIVVSIGVYDENVGWFKGGFTDCDKIVSVKLPETLTIIGRFAFRSCTALESITIPENVTDIQYAAFLWCTSLQNVEFKGQKMTIIDQAVFGGCKSLTKIVIPYGVTELEMDSLEGCDALKEVYLPETVIDIDFFAFVSCKVLEIIVVDEDNPVYYSENNCVIERQSQTLLIGCNSPIPEQVKSIACYAFGGRENLGSIIIPDNVTAIDNGTFWNCTNLKTVTFGGNVETIGGSAFSGCSSLTDVYYTTKTAWKAIEIGENNENLKNATLHYNEVTPSQGLEFYSHGDGTCTVVGIGTCTDVNLVIPSVSPDGDLVVAISYAYGGVWDKGAFKNCDQLESVVIPEGVTRIGDSSFANCKNLKTVELPDSLICIANWAFQYCMKLERVIIPQNVNRIETCAFKGCTRISEVIFEGSGVDIYMYDAFSCCASLEKIVIPEGVTRLDDYDTFMLCLSLQQVYLPNSLTYIGGGVFDSDFRLTDVYYSGSAEDWAKIVIAEGNTYLTSATIHYNYDSTSES